MVLVADRGGMFRISIEEGSSRERWIIQGRLAGVFASELDTAWNSSLQKDPLVCRVVDLRGVISIDRYGQEVLRKMLCDDAEFVSPGIYTKRLLEQLRGSPKSLPREKATEVGFNRKPSL
jgi:hypothetical protein